MFISVYPACIVCRCGVGWMQSSFGQRHSDIDFFYIKVTSYKITSTVYLSMIFYFVINVQLLPCVNNSPQLLKCWSNPPIPKKCLQPCLHVQLSNFRRAHHHTGFRSGPTLSQIQYMPPSTYSDWYRTILLWAHPNLQPRQ